MAEYIEKSILLEAFANAEHPIQYPDGSHGLGLGYAGFRTILFDLTAADVVEVVRCKDCIHRPSRIPGVSDDHEGLNLEFPDDWCPMQCEDGWYNRMPRDDFFCGYGEREEKINGRDTDRH